MPEGSSDLIDSPTNTNRTTLKIINDKYQDWVKAKVEYNKTTGLIETTVTYSKYGINKITFEDTTELPITNTNGIITANTFGTAGKNKIAIIDKNGNKKNIKVTVPFKYGNKVFGYECNTEGIEWRLFHEDSENIYLIADGYIPYENLPTSTNGTALNKGYTNYCAYFTNILNDYTGSSWIRENTNPKSQKWLSKYLTEYPESTNNNIKAVAYMMDTNKWSGFTGEKAEYAIGGPTLEMFCASYKQTHPSKYIKCDSVNENGYQVKWSDSSYDYQVEGLTQDDFNGIYIKSDITNVGFMWIASPSCRTTEFIMSTRIDKSSVTTVYNYGNVVGFRPVVCLKSDVKLMDNGDNTYSIKETITAKAEYNKETNQIEVRIAYSENGIRKIMLNDTNELSMTNTNGIIIANISSINLGGNNRITIIDNKGNKKELEVTVPYGKEYYGKEVTNYTCAAKGVDKWRVFHVDENNNIYLIADDYVPYANLPTSTLGTALNKGITNYEAYFTAILSNYTGSAWIRTNTNIQAQKWLTWINRYPNSTNNNIKAVAYMMDTNKWSGFTGENAEYAIGGPTLELFCASYKVTHPSRYIECNSINDSGYQVKLSDGSYAASVYSLAADDFNSIYIKSNKTKASGMWLASPNARDTNRVTSARCNSSVDYDGYSTTELGFRPVVCLKSGVQILDNGNGTYSIQ